MMAKDNLGAIEKWQWARRCASAAPNVAGRTHWQRWQAAKHQVRLIRKPKLARALRHRLALLIVIAAATVWATSKTANTGMTIGVIIGATILAMWCCRHPIRTFRSEVPTVGIHRNNAQTAWQVAKLLSPLEKRPDFRVIHDLAMGPTAVLDHVVVGPSFVKPVFALRVSGTGIHDEGTMILTAEGQTVLSWNTIADWVNQHMALINDTVSPLGFTADTVLVLLVGPHEYGWLARRYDQARVLVTTVEAATDHFASVVSDGLLAHPASAIEQASEAIRCLYPPRNDTVSKSDYEHLFATSTTDA